MRLKRFEVSAKKARRTCRPEEIEGSVRSNIPLDFVGQERAERAFDVALSPNSKFHMIVVGNIPLEMIGLYIEEKIKKQGVKWPLIQQDYCYVFNFSNPGNPSLLTFGPGEGNVFRLVVKRIRERLQKEIPIAFSEENFQRKMEKIEKESIKKQLLEQYGFFRETIVAEGWQQRWKEKGWILNFSEDRGIVQYLVFKKDLFKEEDWEKIPPEIKEQLERLEGQEINDQVIQKLPILIQNQLMKNLEEVEGLKENLSKILEFIQDVQRKTHEEIERETQKLEEETCEGVMKNVFGSSLELYSKHPKAKSFLENLREHAKENKDSFLPPPTQMVMTQAGPMQVQKSPERQGREEKHLIPFEVNLLVNSKNVESPPVVIATSPTYSELFGKIERKIVFGEFEAGTITDPTMIKPGAFHQASGGFIILDLTDIALTKPSILLGLKRVLTEKKLKIQDPHDESGNSFGGKTLTPEPMPLELKVIVTIQPWLYNLLSNHPLYEELAECFKVSAFFSPDIEYKPKNIKAYAAWTQNYARDKTFLPLDSGAQAKIIEYLLRKTGSQEKFLWDIEKIKTLIKEAHIYAKTEGADHIGEEHIRKAVEEKIYRSNLIQERMKQLIKKGTLLIDIDGEKSGQINGLTVYQLDGFAFGIPKRITATTFRGTRGIISIDKEANLAGKTLAKSVGILGGFFQARYGRDKNISFGGNICFEQSYRGVEGDSATAAELFVIISSIAEVPLKQSIAITGSANQMGEIQPIGGVNEKIEGFYEVCKDRGLTGDQGIIIPKQNLRDLMLKEEVVEAIREGKFHVFAIETVDQGIEILTTDHSAEDIDRLVNKTLKKWSGAKNKTRKKK